VTECASNRSDRARLAWLVSWLPSGDGTVCHCTLVPHTLGTPAGSVGHQFADRPSPMTNNPTTRNETAAGSRSGGRFFMPWRGLPPLAVELGLDGADEAPGALGAHPSRAVAVAGLDDVGAPAERRVAVTSRVRDTSAQGAHCIHHAISPLDHQSALQAGS
jgi:hypothetical protein